MAAIAPLLDITVRLRPALGTFVAVEAQAPGAARCERATAAAFAAIAQVERLMHPTREGSDLAALRTHPLGSPLPIHPWTWAVLKLSSHIHRLSHGVFDPCLPEAAGRLTDVEFAPGVSVVLRRRVCLDLGGIAKGFAVDRALDALRAAGCTGGLVNAGGDLAVFGDRTQFIECRTPAGSAVSVRNAALATSVATSPGAAGHDRPTEHRGHYHGITRRAVRPGHAIVTAPTAALADALTKCVLANHDAASPKLLAALGARQIQF